jgi:hypothetical protein
MGRRESLTQLLFGIEQMVVADVNEGKVCHIKYFYHGDTETRSFLNRSLCLRDSVVRRF